MRFLGRVIKKKHLASSPCQQTRLVNLAKLFPSCHQEAQVRKLKRRKSCQKRKKEPFDVTPCPYALAIPVHDPLCRGPPHARPHDEIACSHAAETYFSPPGLSSGKGSQFATGTGEGLPNPPHLRFRNPKAEIRIPNFTSSWRFPGSPAAASVIHPSDPVPGPVPTAAAAALLGPARAAPYRVPGRC